MSNINFQNSEERLQTSSSSAQQPSDYENNKKFILFRALFRRLTDLLNLLYHQNLRPYYEMVELTISEIKSIRLNLSLFNNNSILDATQQILAIEAKFNKNVNDHYLKQSKHRINEQVEKLYDSARIAFRHLLPSLHYYQS